MSKKRRAGLQHSPLSDLRREKAKLSAELISQVAGTQKTETTDDSLAHREHGSANLVHSEPGSLNQVQPEPSSPRTKLTENLAQNELGSYHITFNILDDEIMPRLPGSEQIVLRRLYRLSYGFHRTYTDPVSLSSLSRKCNLSVSSIKRAIASLEQKQLIRRIGEKKFDPRAGNQYIVLPQLAENLAQNELGSQRTRFTMNHIKIDDDFKSINHHQNVMRIYQEVTGNQWTKQDDQSYSKIQDVDLNTIEQGIRTAFDRAKNHPNSLEYFTREILRLHNPTPQRRSEHRRRLQEIITRCRDLKAGTRYTLGDLAEDVKRVCSKEQVPFDNDLFSELVGLK